MKAADHALPGHLYLVAVPIGNLSDITRRGKAILATCDLIACEKKRKTERLLKHLEISAKTLLYHEHNEKKMGFSLADRIASGESVALVSEAGTPGISDPGFRVVRECRKRGLPVVPLPGPSAFLTALAASGLPSDGFLFLGFLPPRKAARKGFFHRFLDFEYTLICYESPYRITKFLSDLIEVLGSDRTICVARELTKRHETFRVGCAGKVFKELKTDSLKGEFVVLIAKKAFRL